MRPSGSREACLAARATLVFVSTVAVSAVTEYGKSKAAAEEDIRRLGGEGLSFSIVRFPLLYGPHGHGNMERMLEAIRAWTLLAHRGSRHAKELPLSGRRRAGAAPGGRARPGRHLRRRTLPRDHAGRDPRGSLRGAGSACTRLTIPRGAAMVAAGVMQAGLGLAGRSTRLPDQVETLTSPAGFDGGPFARATGFVPEVGLVEGMRRTARWLEGHDGVRALLLAAACAVVSALVVRVVRDFANRRALLDLPNDRSSHRPPGLAWAG